MIEVSESLLLSLRRYRYYNEKKMKFRNTYWCRYLIFIHCSSKENKNLMIDYHPCKIVIKLAWEEMKITARNCHK